MEEGFDLAVGVEPCRGVGDGAGGAPPGEVGGAAGSGVAAGVAAREVEERAPRGGIAPAAVGGFEDCVEVGFERETTVLSEGGIGDCS